MNLCISIKSTLFTVLIILLFARMSYSQDTAKIRALEYGLAAAKEDTAKARILNALGWAYHKTNPDTAMFYVRQALVLAEKQEDKKNMSIAKYYIGRLYYIKSDDSTALKYFDDVLKIDEELKNTADMSTVHMYKGYSYFRMNRSADMLNEFLLSLKFAEQSGNKERISDALYSISDYYMHQEDPELGEIEKAEPYLQKALAIDKELNNKSNIATDYQNLGLCFTRQKKYAEAEDYLNISIKMFKEIDDIFHEATAYSYLGNLYDEMNEYDRSIENYLTSQKLLESLGAKNEIADNADNIAAEFFRKKDYVNALKYGREGLAVAKEVNAKRQMFFLYNTMAKASAALNDFENAYNYVQQATTLHDSIYQQEQHDKLAELQTQFETEKKEKENQVLKAQNLATTSQLREKEILLTAAIAGIVMLAILLYLLYRNRQAKIRNIELLRNLNKQLEKQKEEITRINTLLELKALRAQMNPHFIFNCMSSIQECMLTGRLNEANTYLSKLSRLLRMVLIHSDDENITLNKELEMLSLYLELESLRFKGSFLYNIDVDEEIITEDLIVPALILQPFAENAIWHGLMNKAGDRKLSVSLKLKEETLQCIVEDNGIGREKAALLQSRHSKHDSRGVKLIEKRVEILKHQSNQPQAGIAITNLYNTNNEPTGTKVEINLPLITL